MTLQPMDILYLHFPELKIDNKNPCNNHNPNSSAVLAGERLSDSPDNCSSIFTDSDQNDGIILTMIKLVK